MEQILRRGWLLFHIRLVNPCEFVRLRPKGRCCYVTLKLSLLVTVSLRQNHVQNPTKSDKFSFLTKKSFFQKHFFHHKFFFSKEFLF